MHYLEYNFELFYITFIYNLKHSSYYRLSNKYDKYFALRCKLASYIMVAGCISTIITYSGLNIYCSYAAIFESDIKYSTILVIIWFILTNIGIIYVFALVFFFAYFIYIQTIYLKCRFQQILTLIDIYLQKGIYYGLIKEKNKN